MFYVYVLRSKTDGKLYTGFTPDLKTRLRRHESGEVVSIEARRPFDLLVFAAFKNRDKDLEFEQYLKTGSGRAFSRKRLLPTLPGDGVRVRVYPTKL